LKKRFRNGVGQMGAEAEKGGKRRGSGGFDIASKGRDAY